MSGLIQVYTRRNRLEEALRWYQQRAALAANDAEAQYAVGVFVWQELFREAAPTGRVRSASRSVEAEGEEDAAAARAGRYRGRAAGATGRSRHQVSRAGAVAAAPVPRSDGVPQPSSPAEGDRVLRRAAAQSGVDRRRREVAAPRGARVRKPMAFEAILEQARGTAAAGRLSPSDHADGVGGCSRRRAGGRRGVFVLVRR